MLTLGEFKAAMSHVPDETPISVLLPDGRLDYAVMFWLAGPDELNDTDNGEESTIVIAPN